MVGHARNKKAARCFLSRAKPTRPVLRQGVKSRASMARKLRYLTVQDILWINLQATGRVNEFNFAALEEATFGQYAYGSSDDLRSQATRLAKGFVAKSPLAEGNEATALIAVATFLRLNGAYLSVCDDEAAAWLASGASVPELQIGHGDHQERMKDAVTQVLLAYPRAVQQLGGNPLAIVADGAIH